MESHFDEQKAKKFLEKRELHEKEHWEKERKAILAESIDSLKFLFFGTAVEVYLVGSILQPFMFHGHSDVDVVLKNFEGDRFDIWTKLETMVGKNIEVIIFEQCPFQEYVIQRGFKVI